MFVKGSVNNNNKKNQILTFLFNLEIKSAAVNSPVLVFKVTAAFVVLETFSRNKSEIMMKCE